MNGLGHRWDGPADGPVVVLGPSLGTTLDLWDTVVADLAARWRVLRFDLPGHNTTPALPGPYTIVGLADHVTALLDRYRLERVAYCGISLSGAIGQELATREAGRFTSLTLICTAARFGDPAAWVERAARVRAEGTGWLAGTAPDRWLTTTYARSHPVETSRLVAMLLASNPDGYAGCCEALAGFDMRHRLGTVVVPTLVIAGADDPATPPAWAAELAAAIPAARLCVLAAASHLANIEHPATVAHLIHEHVQQALGGRT